MIESHNTGETPQPPLYSPEELARCQAFLGDKINVGPQHLAVARCVECIASRIVSDPALPDNKPVVTNGEVSGCITNNPDNIFVDTEEARTILSAYARRGSLTRVEIPGVYPGKTMGYQLAAAGRETQPLEPRRKIGCIRSDAAQLHHTLSLAQSKILAHMAKMSPEDARFGFGSSDARMLEGALKTLVSLASLGILKEIGEEEQSGKRRFRLAVRGIWLAESLGLRPQEELHTTNQTANALIPRIKKLYPEDMHKPVLGRVLELCNQGILEAAQGHEASDDTSVKLDFSPKVLGLSRQQRIVLAYGLRVDRLIFGQPILKEDLYRYSGTATPEELHVYTKKLYEEVQTLVSAQMEAEDHDVESAPTDLAS